MLTNGVSISKLTILNKSRSYNSKSNKKPIPKATTVCHSPPSHKILTCISDLKDLASSHLDDLTLNLIDCSHSEILKDLEASHSCLCRHTLSLSSTIKHNQLSPLKYEVLMYIYIIFIILICN
ncbi:hypothetical protein CFOL_v3_18877 [Cephalotus follicularis]|uniref:Uncharacterized protein n=1 Tax=Cephalotus follicularis TaxID=3775 RepID=A0A1Q3C5N1_CEPFO|nr:hypothetical protein CFOL_v3_18877 [Cephalotus follicularis]